MNDTQNNILEKDLSSLFGFEGLTDEEKAALLDDIGSTILESATLKFMVESDPETVTKFEILIEEQAEKEEMLEKILETFPRFEEVLREEVVAFKEEAVAVLGK